MICVCPGCSALSEMESMLLSVLKDRRSQRKQTVFVDTLLQSNLAERQVKADDVQISSSESRRQLEDTQSSETA